MKVYLVTCTVDLGYHVEAVFLDKQKAEDYRQQLSDNDSLVQRRKALGDEYADLYDVEEFEVSDHE